MSFDTKEDLQRVCEAILGYQKSLEEIDKYIDRLNRRMTELNEKAGKEETQNIFAEYNEILDSVQGKMAGLHEAMDKITQGEEGIVEQMKFMRRFFYAVRNFEETMEKFNHRADSLSQKLYNKDFNNAVKAMNSIAQDAKRSGTYEYKHITNHDYDILQHEYKLALEKSSQRDLIDAYLLGAYHLLCDASLRRDEYEALQRLMEKMVHSDSKALTRFIKENMPEKIK